MKWWSLLLLLGVAAFLPLSLWVVLLSNSPLVWCFFPLPPLFGGAVSLIPSLFGGAVSHPLSSFLFFAGTAPPLPL